MINKKIIGYVGINDVKNLKEEDIKCLDIVNLAFGVIREGSIVCDLKSFPPYREKAKLINPDIKFVLSVGGWGADGFSQAASTDESREKFAKSAVNLVKTYALDGIDIDWEYPCVSIAGIKASKEDKENFTLFLKKLREELNKITDRHLLLTIAAGGDAFYVRCTNMDKAGKYLDYVQLMTYDLRGGFSVATGHHTNLYSNKADLYSASVDFAVKQFVKAGVPKEKLVVGVAFYSRIWRGVPSNNNGLSQMAETTGGYGPEYGQLVKEYIDQNGYIRYWDEEAKAPYLYNGNEFISYDDEQSISYKANYVIEEDLFGLMYWEYKCDSSCTLTKFMAEQLNTKRKA